MIHLGEAVAVVTGSARRIGAEIAATLAQAGCAVVINYRSSADEAGATVQRLTASGARAVAVQGDMSKRADAQHLLDATLSAYGRADLLVANASVFQRTPLAEINEANWRYLLDNNLAASFWPAQAFGLHMQARGSGCMVLIADVAAYRPWAGYTPYNAAKAGVISLTHTLAKELAPAVRVNAIAPGPMLFPDDYDEASRDREIQRTLLKRAGSPQHIADAVLALVKNDYITGAVLPVDGGRGLL